MKNSRPGVDFRFLSILLVICLAVGFVMPEVRAQFRDLSQDDRGMQPEPGMGLVPPGDHDDECGDDEGPDGELLTCVITQAVVDDSVNLLMLGGEFCDEPLVLVGRPNGEMEHVYVAGSDVNYIVADLGSIEPAGTFPVRVQCPCDPCSIDVTAGVSGPTGPTGPQGIPGAPDPELSQTHVLRGRLFESDVVFVYDWEVCFLVGMAETDIGEQGYSRCNYDETIGSLIVLTAVTNDPDGVVECRYKCLNW